jgi:hypothetical protein
MRIDRHGEVHSRFSQFCEKRLKTKQKDADCIHMTRESLKQLAVLKTKYNELLEHLTVRLLAHQEGQGFVHLLRQPFITLTSYYRRSRDLKYVKIPENHLHR